LALEAPDASFFKIARTAMRAGISHSFSSAGVARLVRHHQLIRYKSPRVEIGPAGVDLFLQRFGERDCTCRI
jgi:hypothetical protein